MVSSEDLSAQGFSNPDKLPMVNYDSPSPPLKKLIHPRSRSWTGGVFKEVYNVAPENLVVEVAVYSPPGSYVGKCKSYLQSSM